ncbi:MAG TPA: GatB/YqeY domain-containing protein, partial [Anaerolineae bacterium]|nr:GatB/YqeY domain-containing protein [Anaerolineae bacterium]
VLAVVMQQAKQRRDSIAEFEKAKRTDLIEKEAAELAILEQYLPAQLSEAEIEAKAKAVIAELGVTDAKGMGQVMKQMVAELKGQADGKMINQVVRKLLS